MNSEYKQKTFDGGLIPSPKHPDDIVVCEDTGNTLRRTDAHLDTQTGAYYESETALQEVVEERNDNLFSEWFNNEEEFIENMLKDDGHWGSYTYLCSEDSASSLKAISDAICDLNYDTPKGLNRASLWSKPLRKRIVKEMLERILGADQIKILIGNQYGSTMGEIRLTSLSEEEHENQIEFSRLESDLGSQVSGPFLSTFLSWANRQKDFCLGDLGSILHREYLVLDAQGKIVSRHDNYYGANRVRKPDAIVQVITHDRPSAYANFYQYIYVGLTVYFTVTWKTIHETLAETVLDYCQSADFNRNGKLD